MPVKELPLNHPALRLLRELVVYSPDDKRRRFGNSKKGGYVVFEKTARNSDAIYSFGVDEHNIGFDLSITRKLKLPCRAFAQDDKNTFSEHVIKHHDQQKNILVKMDLEGGEWGFLEKLTPKDMRQITQMVIEFHGLDRPENWERFSKILQKINEHYYLCHVHANNTVGRGILFDKIFYLHNRTEATFLRKDVVKAKPNTTTQFPTSSDRPNEARPQIPLEGWPYQSDTKSLKALSTTLKLARLRSFFQQQP